MCIRYKQINSNLAMRKKKKQTIKMELYLCWKMSRTFEVLNSYYYRIAIFAKNSTIKCPNVFLSEGRLAGT